MYTGWTENRNITGQRVILYKKIRKNVDITFSYPGLCFQENRY